ncbi:MAG: hypothetical protein IPO67_16495 [Deltaproteobacteria bacterium]|nr:hypothetical protein [Deltaproteobacteria bacterium]
MRTLTGLFIVAFGLGCNTECADLDRFNGRYEVFGAVRSHTPEDLGALRTDALFYNGTREWDLVYAPSNDVMRLMLPEGELTANYEEGASGCNTFHLDMPTASWEVDVTELTDEEPVISSHTVRFTADIVWTGAGFTGVYDVEDQWALSTGESGSLSAEGTLSATRLDAGGEDG